MSKKKSTIATTAKRLLPKSLAITALVSAVVIAIIASVIGYKLWYQNPDKVVHDSLLSAITSKSISSTGSVIYSGDNFALNVELNGRSSDSSGDIAAVAKMSAGSGGAKQQFKAMATARLIDGVVYVKLKGIEKLVNSVARQSNGQIPGYAPEVFKSLENQWIRIEPSDYQSLYKDIASFQACLGKVVKEASNKETAIAQIANLYRANKFILVKNSLGSKLVDGTDSFGFLVSIDKNIASSFLSQLKQTDLGKDIEKCGSLLDFDPAINEPIELNLWVSKFGHEITELSAQNINAVGGQADVLVQPSFNHNIKIEVPDKAISLKIALGKIQKIIRQFNSGAYPSSEVVPLRPRSFSAEPSQPST